MANASVFRCPNLSLWVRNRVEEAPTFSKLKGRVPAVDVAVIGGGIVGLTTAMKLRDLGKSVAVIEAARIGSGVTGNSTAKISSLHSLVYDSLRKRFGDDGIRKYAALNEAGLDLIEHYVKKYNIDCDFLRSPNYTFTTDPRNIHMIKNEVVAAKAAGLDAEFTQHIDELPFKVAGAIKVQNQGQFNSYSYCIGLAKQLAKNGAVLYEHSRVKNVSKFAPHHVKTEDGELEAAEVVFATHLPILDLSLHFAFCEPVQSYCIATTLTDESIIPQGMYITVEGETSTISLRGAKDPSGRKCLIVGGQGHKMGKDPDGDNRVRYHQLELWTRQNYPVKEVIARWSAHDYKPADNVYYIGHLMHGTQSMYTATGFKKWGIAAGSAAGIIISDLITGRKNPWVSLVDARRWDVTHSAIEFAKINLNVGFNFVKDRIANYTAKHRKASELEVDEGGICDHNGKIAAAYRDQDGILHALSPVCTHKYCHVVWNTADRTWDCPCHGSRFRYDGDVIHGPAVDKLKNLD